MYKTLKGFRSARENWNTQNNNNNTGKRLPEERDKLVNKVVSLKRVMWCMYAGGDNSVTCG